MALASSISRSAMVPAIATKYPAGVAVAPVTPTALTEVDERAPLTDRGDRLRYTGSLRDDSGAGTRPPQARKPGREMNGALLENSSESFVSAFASVFNVAGVPGTSGGRVTQAALTRGIGSYETTSSVIHDEMPAKGGKLSINL